MNNFTNASASVTGSSHYKLYYNNQDGYHFYQNKSCIIGVVADGCGGGSHSEVGAKLGVDFVVNFCRKHFQDAPFEVEVLKNGLVEYLRNVVKNQRTAEELEFIENYLFFTLFGFIVQPQRTFIFHSGDGLYCLNEREVVVDQDNRPDYIAKTLIGGEALLASESMETKQVSRLLVATDGLTHLNQKFLQGESVEGLTSLSGFFDNEDFFDDPVSLPAFLTGLSVNRNILKDDTTMIMLKRSGQ